MYEYYYSVDQQTAGVQTQTLCDVLWMYARVVSSVVYLRIFVVLLRFSSLIHKKKKKTSSVLVYSRYYFKTITFGSRCRVGSRHVRSIGYGRCGYIVVGVRAANCRTCDANLNNIALYSWRCNFKFKNRNADGWPPQGSLCCRCVLRWRGGSQIISGHLEQPAGYPPTFQKERKREREKREKRIKFQDFTNRFMLTRLGDVLEYIPLRHLYDTGRLVKWC